MVVAAVRALRELNHLLQQANLCVPGSTDLYHAQLQHQNIINSMQRAMQLLEPIDLDGSDDQNAASTLHAVQCCFHEPETLYNIGLVVARAMTAQFRPLAGEHAFCLVGRVNAYWGGVR